MPLKFSVIETTTSPLWDYGWFDITRFKVDGSMMERQNPREVLGGFLKDSISQRSFCTTPDPWRAPVGQHGPFLREKLLPEYFQPLSPPDLARKVQIALSDPEFDEPPSQEQVVPVESWVKAVETRGDSAFALCAPSEPGVRVDYDFIWFVFCEFICLSRMQEELTVAVIGYE